ncbi:MAG: hypothetical protein GF317_11025 [Candidatus Lokiarchaeota archaeon]|nr:hypothetical protein [Candidatus Lokiarchaeota archaeon]MBD3200195.1 hypothetical protein [Candidatus Lokiarchaeota archaeon]
MREEVELFARETGKYLSFSKAMPPLTNNYDKVRWLDDRVKAYHIIYGLCEFLGFDPLLFGALETDIIPGRYRRHHFRDSNIRKVSSNVRDLILTDSWNHYEYEQYNERFMVAVLNSIKNVIYDASITEISPADMLNSLRKNMGHYFLKNAEHVDGVYKVNPFIEKGRNTKSEFLTAGQLVEEVWIRWNDREPLQAQLDPTDPTETRTLPLSTPTEFLKDNLKVFNKRRKDYLLTGKFDYFLKKEYSMGPDSEYVKHAQELDSMIRGKEIPNHHGILYRDSGANRLIKHALESTPRRLTDEETQYLRAWLENLRHDV